MKNENIAQGVRCLCLQDNRFKTMRLSVGMFLPLRQETAAANAILPELLTRATAAAPTMAAMHRRLQRLYGALVSSGVQRLGEHQVLTISITCLENRFALGGEDMVAQLAALFYEMLFTPHLSADGLFDETDFKQEKRCLQERISASLNDKRAYAREKAEALMADGESYGVSPYGTADAAAALTRESVTAAWKTMLKTAVFQCIYIGADDGKAMTARLRDAFAGQPRLADAGVTKTDFTPLSTPREQATHMAVNQAKLCMCFRLCAHEPDAKAVATGRLLATLFGGAPCSLLFRNVREKMSLCYYCSAGFERVKGVLTVNSGVDADNLQAAKAEILRQLRCIQNGDFSETDLENAKRYLVHQLKEHDNLQGGTSSWYMGQSLSPAMLKTDAAAQLVMQVKKADIIALANTVNLQSVFAVMPNESKMRGKTI